MFFCKKLCFLIIKSKTKHTVTHLKVSDKTLVHPCFFLSFLGYRFLVGSKDRFYGLKSCHFTPTSHHVQPVFKVKVAKYSALSSIFRYRVSKPDSVLQKYSSKERRNTFVT
ncbi:hypothetical protein V6Z11_D06G253900 [Gossypium hirsutum]